MGIRTIHMHDKILVPTDGSDRSDAAVAYAIDLAEAMDAELHALYVIETRATYILTVSINDSEMEEYEEYGEQLVTDVVDRAVDRGVREATGAVMKGKIAEQIINYVEDNDISQIVIGKQGQGAIEKYVGSTADKVIRMSNVPVTIVDS